MISRALLLSRQQYKGLIGLGSRATATSPVSSTAVTDTEKHNTLQRLVRQEPGKVRLAFIPEEWFTFFYKKTGVTGLYTFGVTFCTYLISKEIFIMEHEYYNGLSLLMVTILLVTKGGPKLAAYLDKEIDEYEASWTESRNNEMGALEAQIKNEERLQWSNEGQNMVIQAKRENVALQLEACYRSRIQTVFQEVKRRLDYQAELENIEKRIAQKNLVDWVSSRVKSSITSDQEKQNIDKCIADLGALAKV